MRLLNFTFLTPLNEVVVNAKSAKWDLHNLAKYSGMTVKSDGSTTLEWVVLPNPHRPDDPSVRGCAFVFRGLRLIKVSGRDCELPKSEDLTIHGISCVPPQNYRYNKIDNVIKEPSLEMPIHLLFAFRGGLTIEIDAEEVEFVLRD